jgi:hypothetical protein
VPTSTGDAPAGSVWGRAARSHAFRLEATVVIDEWWGRRSYKFAVSRAWWARDERGLASRRSPFQARHVPLDLVLLWDADALEARSTGRLLHRLVVLSLEHDRIRERDDRVASAASRLLPIDDPYVRRLSIDEITL